MRRQRWSRIWFPFWAGLVLLTSLFMAPLARADEPPLSIRLTDGQQTIYAVSALERIGFEGDTLVVASAGGTERYGAATVVRIAFDLPKAGPVELAIYSVNGWLIRRLVKDRGRQDVIEHLQRAAGRAIGLPPL